MKKIINILLSMGVLLMALSCVETNGLDEVLEGEICMSPVLSDMVRTRADDSNTIPYPDGQSFGAFAYYSQAEANVSWNGTLQEYFTNNEFKNEGGQCTGNPSVYWPFSGSLIFAGYSPYDKDADVDFDAGSATLSITGFEVDGTKNLMYFLPEYTDEEYVRYGKETSSLGVKFNHAMSCVAFGFTKGEGNKSVTLKQVRLSSVKTKANFSVSASNPSALTWSDLSEEKDLVVWEGEETLYATSFEIKSYVIPGNATDIVISYQVDGETDVKEKALIPQEITTWAINTKNTYNITINSMGELVLTPTVTINHVDNSEGKLAGSNVSVNLGVLNDDDLDRISKLKIVVSNGATVYRTYEQKDGEKLTSNVVYMPDNSNLPYLKQGDYQIALSYNDGLKDQTISARATPPSPKFKVTVSGSKKSGTHTNTGATISVTSSVSISDNVLKQLPLSDCEVRLSDLATWYIGSANSTTSQFIAKEIEGKWENNYTLTSQVTFDGKTVSASSTTVSLQPTANKFKLATTAVQNAAQLKHEGYYFIRLSTCGANSIMTCSSASGFELAATNLSAERAYGMEGLSNTFIFKFSRFNGSASNANYESTCEGTLQSYASKRYINWDDSNIIKFDLSNPDQNRILFIANRWKTDTTKDQYVDIYHNKDTGGKMIGRNKNNTKQVIWGNTGSGASFEFNSNDVRKWEFIEAIPQ